MSIFAERKLEKLSLNCSRGYISQTKNNNYENKEIIHTSFTKNDFGLSQSNFRYDLLSTGSKFRINSKEKFNPYISYGSFGINIKKLGPNTSPTLSDRVSFWKNKQIHNFEKNIFVCI